MRLDNRENNALRVIKIIPHYTKHAEGSVLIEYGDTKVLCNASVTSGVPRFLKGQGQGWITAEYGLLPRSTHERNSREAVRGVQSGRTMEIQRLIGRSLRAAVNLQQLGENTITIDCDVIQADGGTRTASITGGCVALRLALAKMYKKLGLAKDPFKQFIAAISVGIYQGVPLLDLDYKEDSNADTDMNIVMNEQLEFIEIQGTAEGKGLQAHQINSMLDLGHAGITQLLELQRTF